MICYNISDLFIFYITGKRILILDRNLSNYKKEDL